MRNGAARLLACAGMFVAMTSARAVELLESVSYTDQNGHTWCATVTYIERGRDGREWVWLTHDVDPRRITHVPVADLVVGCK